MDRFISRHRLKATLNRYRGDVTQTSKRVMLNLGFVPPPLRITIDITDRCNFQCPTCSKWKADNATNELGTNEWKTAIEKITNLSLFKEIVISGGEPFTRPDIIEILEFAKKKNFTVGVISNGWLVNKKILKRLNEIGVDSLMVSLNSLKESAHDESRSASGSFRRIMKLLETWREQPLNIDFYLSTVVMEQNCGELSELACFAQEKGLNGIIFQVLAPEEAHYPFSRVSSMQECSITWYMDNPLWARSIDILRQEISKLLRLQKESSIIINPATQLKKFPLYYENPDAIRKIPCLGTLSRMYIDPFGDMRLCYGYPPIGNILSDDPKKTWRSIQAEEIRFASKKCDRLCRLLNCNL